MRDFYFITEDGRKGVRVHGNLTEISEALAPFGLKPCTRAAYNACDFDESRRYPIEHPQEVEG